MNLFSFYSILSVLGRGNYQLSIINYQLLKHPTDSLLPVAFWSCCLSQLGNS